MIRLLFILCCLAPLCLQAQDTLQFSEFRTAVLRFHPMLKKASLAAERGQANLLRAKGYFDPKLEANSASKFYKGKNYYSLQGAQIKYPTPFAMELKGGFDLNDGTYLDPSLTTSNQGLVSLGVSMPLLQGLVMDERRAMRKVANAFVEYSELEQAVLTNELLLIAYDSYWQWWSSFEKKRMSEEILQFSLERMSNVRTRALLGQAAVFDTVEARIQVGLRTQQFQEFGLLELKSRYFLSTMLWQGDSLTDAGVYVNDGTLPANPREFDEIDGWLDENFLKQLDTLQWTNPELQQYDANLKMTSAELRWKREKIKPKLNLQYHFLNEPIGSSNESGFSTENYKWGMEFSFPLLAREARGDMRTTQIKLEEIGLSYQQKTQETKNKALTAYRSLFALQDQLDITAQNVDGYFALLEGERIKFMNGESSLFMVNQREIQYAEARIKQIDLQQKKIKNYLELLFHMGIIQRL
jgi:outer membrane protein TolC